MFDYKQNPRALKISGVIASVTGTDAANHCNVAFSAAAIAAVTNLGTWPLSSWITVAGTDALGTTFTFLREGLYEVTYSIPFTAAAPTTLQAGIGYQVAAAQLTADPEPANTGVFAVSSLTSVTVEGATLTGTKTIAVRKSQLAAGAAQLNLLASNGGDAAPPAGVTVAQVTLWITQINHLWG